MSARSVLVAGASAGIGAALVRALAADGDRVFACARRGEALSRITENDALARSRVCDVTDDAQVRALVAWIGSETPALDALIVCAGGFGAIGPIETTDSEQWWATLRSNVLPLYLLAKHALPLLERGSARRIVVFSSGVAYSPFPRYSGYAVSKAAVIRLAASLADELADRRIAVNVVLPGMVATEIHAATVAAGPDRAGGEHFERTRAIQQGGGVPIDVPVDCVRFLLSPEADGLTGKTVAANFDPWRRFPAVCADLSEISRSPLYTVRRIMPADLPDGPLKERLS